MGLGLSVRGTRLAKAYLSIGRRDDALTCARSAVELSTKHHERANQALALEALADITACDDTAGPGDAVDLYARSLALANELGMRPLVAHCRAGLGTLHRRIGSRGESDDHLAAAADRKSTRLNSSHSQISYAVFCLKKKNTVSL